MTTKHTPDRDNSIACQLWIQKELLDWIDEAAEQEERSRAFWINRALRVYVNRLVADRGRRANRAA